MPCRYPLRMFHTVSDLSERWKISPSAIRQWLSGGDLTALVWLPVMSAVERGEDGAGEAGGSLCHWEGYIHVSGHQCRRLFRQGWIALREFSSQDRRRRFRVPEAADDLIVELQDLIILEAERRRFEAAWPALARAGSEGSPSSSRQASATSAAHDPTYRVVRMSDGREVRFGETQAKVLRLLADAARGGEPWQSGKALLREAGSEGFSISNLFKRHPAWRELVASDGRGHYRLAGTFAGDSREIAARS